VNEQGARLTSRNIPLPIQRQVRQRCGFGCIVCGLPLFEYDHLLGWANVQRHVAEELTILCDQHHREKGSGLLPLDVVNAANRNPFNLQNGVSKPYDLHYSGEECEIVIGGNSFCTKDAGYGTILLPISVDGVPLLGFILGDGHLLLNLNVFDEYNCLLLQIKNNQIFYSTSPSTWDVQLVGRNLVVRLAERKILIDIVFELPNRIVINRGRFLKNGVEILIRPDKLVLANNGTTFSSMKSNNRLGGILIGPHENPVPSLIRVPEVHRYVHIRQGVEEWIAEEFERKQ
jgi:hypothetical protein